MRKAFAFDRSSQVEEAFPKHGIVNVRVTRSFFLARKTKRASSQDACHTQQQLLPAETHTNNTSVFLATFSRRAPRYLRTRDAGHTSQNHPTVPLNFFPTMNVRQEAKPQDSPGRHRHSPGALDFSQIVGGAMFGRPPMSEAEMEAVDSGGAESAPEVCGVHSVVEVFYGGDGGLPWWWRCSWGCGCCCCGCGG